MARLLRLVPVRPDCRGFASAEIRYEKGQSAMAWSVVLIGICIGVVMVVAVIGVGLILRRIAWANGSEGRHTGPSPYRAR